MDFIDFDKLPIAIQIRDVNGRRSTIGFNNREAAYLSLTDTACPVGDEDEILLVIQGGTVIYSAIDKKTPLTVDDIIGYLA